MTPEEQHKIAVAKHGCLHIITTLLIIAIFVALTPLLGSTINLYLTTIFNTLGMVIASWWLATTIYGPGPSHRMPEPPKSQE